MKKLYGLLLMFMPFLAMGMLAPLQKTTPINVTQEMVDKFQELHAIPREDVRLTSHPRHPAYGFSATKGLLYMDIIENDGFGPEFAQKLSFLKNLRDKIETLGRNKEKIKNIDESMYNDFWAGTISGNKTGHHDIFTTATRAFREPQTPQSIQTLLEVIQKQINGLYDGSTNFNRYLEIYDQLFPEDV